jgi:hypothetical protein
VTDSAGPHQDNRPVDDVVAEADRIINAVIAAHVPARLTGGVAIRRRCQSTSIGPLARDYADVDLVVKQGAQEALTSVMVALGYVSDKIFNALHGIDRLYYHDLDHGRHVDVFVGSIKMCHTIDVSTRLERLPDTLTLTDLFLTKLQVVQLGYKDLLDLIAILLDHDVVAASDEEIDSSHLEEVWAGNWPLWRTCQLTLQKVETRVDEILRPEASAIVHQKVVTVDHVLRHGHKTSIWKLRNRVGDRIRWYELPEEIEQ